LVSARRRILRESKRARRAMWLENLVSAFWPAWAVIAAFLGLALLDIPATLGFAGHVALLVVFGLALVATLWLGARAVRRPRDADAVARLDAGTRDRPVETLRDTLSVGVKDEGSQALWLAHKRRMAERAMAVRAAPADLRVSDRDRYALRHAALLALAAGVAAQLGDGGGGLAAALTPRVAAAGATAGAEPSMEAWASPPVYTGVAPLYLTERIGEPNPIALPEGTEVTLRVFDTGDAPTIAGLDDAAFEPGGERTWTATIVLSEPVSLSAAAGAADLGGWHFDVISDRAPEIFFTTTPRGARSGALEFAFETADDHGVLGAVATLRLDESAMHRGAAPDTVFEPVAFDLPLPLTADPEAAAELVTQDLTEHPWAGLPVVLTLTATDGAGQTASVDHAFEMPGRRFIDPLAKAVIEERRSLAWRVANAERVLRVLEAVTAYPEDIFQNVSAYIALRSAVRRLDYALVEDTVADETPGIAEMLWLAALRIEDGSLSDAERRLRQIQQELSDAIENGASPDEIARLMDELRQAMNEYLQQLAQEAMRNQDQSAQQQPMDPNQTMTQQDLNDMLSAIEEMLRSGMEEQARQMLQQLQQMLENLQMAQPGQQQQQGQGQGNQAMQELQDMIGEQQGLADRSFEALRDGQQQGQQRGQGQQQGQGQPGEGQQGQQFGQGGAPREGQGQRGQGGEGGGGMGGDLGDIARDQEALRQMLDQMRDGLPGGGGPAPLNDAERSMGAARDALREGDADGALQNQVEALDSLREGARELAEQMQQGQPGQGQQAGREGRSGNVDNEDPFGRPRASNGPMDGDSVRVPDASVMQRARELMDEIRRRAGERTRPPAELDYLRRLLDRF
jgi:uncharacterized protein (TIGR02302 family)